MKENFPNLVKERDMEVQEASPASPFGTESPKQDGCEEARVKTYN